jgi:hypothetical protein
VLRAVVLVAAGLIGVAGVILVVTGNLAPGAYALAVSGVVLLGTLFERWRYRRADRHPDPGWEATGERFEDPETGKTVRVFFDPRTGERRYVSGTAD